MRSLNPLTPIFTPRRRTGAISPGVTPPGTTTLACFTWSFDNYLGTIVTFDSTCSISDTGITGWSWDFGDGTTSNLPNPTHIFPATDTYNVTLTITPTSGTPATTTIPVLVGGVTAIIFYPPTTLVPVTSWPDRETVRLGDYAINSEIPNGYGKRWLDAWYSEYYAPSLGYEWEQDHIAGAVIIEYQPTAFAPYGPWPTYNTVKTGDYARNNQIPNGWGRRWFDAWYLESGATMPADYDATTADMGRIIFYPGSIS